MSCTTLSTSAITKVKPLLFRQNKPIEWTVLSQDGVREWQRQEGANLKPKDGGPAVEVG